MSALLPRLQGAQDIARDTSRQTALSQLQGGIVAYYSLNGKWPYSGNNNTIVSGDTKYLEETLRTSNLMNSLPIEPNENNELNVWWIGENKRWSVTGGYYYEYMRKNWTKNAWLILVAKTETPGKSNIKCSNITGDDVKNFHYCKQLELTGTTSNDPCQVTNEQADEYCYILVY